MNIFTSLLWAGRIGLTWLALTVLSLPMLLAAHQGSLRGTLYDTETQTPIVGAEITIPALSRGTYSDELGYFALIGLPEGSYELNVSRLGYAPITQVVRIDSNQSATFRLGLTPRDIQIDEVTISDRVRPGNNLRSIQAIDLQLRPLRTSQDALKAVPGLFIAQHAGGGKAEQIFLRGFDIDHGTDINLSVDGMPVNMVSHAHGQGYSDLHFLIPETIEEVDFAKGPYDSRYGDFTTAGYAAFRTRRALDQSQVKLEVGQFNTFRGVGMIDLLPGGERHHAYLASEYTFTDGYFESPQDFTRLNVMGKYHGQVADRTLLTVTASTFRSEWDASGQIPLRAVERGLIGRFGAIDDTEGGNTGRSNVNLQLTQVLGEGELLKQQFFYSHYDFTLYSNFTFFLEDSLNGDQIRQRESRDIYGYNGSYQREYALGNTRMRTEVGLSLRADAIEDNELSRTRNREELLDRLAYGDVREVSASVYLDQNWWVSRWFSVNAGLRYDQFRFAYEDQLTAAYDPKMVNKGIASPKLNLNVTLSPRLRLYLSGGTGFHSNDARVVLANTTDDILPRAYGSDLGLVLKPFKGMLIQAAAWGLVLDQEFVYVGDAAVVEPSGKTRRMGTDLSLRYQATPWLYVDADLNYTLARAVGEAEGANYIPLAPSLTSIGGATLRLPWGLEGSLRYRYLADRPANEDYSVVAEGYFLLDAVVQYRYRNLQLSLSVENLTDVAWREAQFDTETRLRGEDGPTSEIHFTPGTPRFARMSMSYFF
jgi:outer membrane receptor protein involved in Fe transport